MSISSSLSIPGWMDVPDLEWLADRASRCKSIVEVGSWMGRSTRALASNTLGVVYAVDTFEGSQEHQTFLADKSKDWLYEVFLKNTSDLENLRVLRMTSLMASEYLKDQLFNMVFIDAAHEYESISVDIKVWKVRVRPGGILCGHDRGFPSVSQAVLDCFGTLGNGTSNIWCIEI